MAGPITDTDASAEATQLSGRPSPSIYSPSAFTALPRANRPSSDRVQPAYRQGARTPIPELVVALAAVAAVFVLVRRALATTGGGGQGGPGPTWWRVALSLTTQGQSLSVAGADGSRVWVAFGALIVALLTVLALVRRIGLNGRLTMFGGGIALLALPGLWMLPLIETVGHRIDRTEAIFRLTVALAVLVGQSFFARWVFSARTWRAGRLPGTLGALFLWVPILAAEGWYHGSLLFTYVARDENFRGHSAWVPTETIDRAQLIVTRGTGVLLGALLVVVAVTQHLAMAKERAVRSS